MLTTLKVVHNLMQYHMVIMKGELHGMWEGSCHVLFQGII